MTQPPAGPRPIGGPDAAAMPACPFVGRIDDPALVDAMPAREHRCYKPPSPNRVRTDIQARFCLSARYQRCPVYRGVVASPPGPALGERLFGGGLSGFLGSREGLAFIFFAMLIPAVIGVAFAVLNDDGDDAASDEPVLLSDITDEQPDPSDDPSLPAAAEQAEEESEEQALAAVEEEPAQAEEQAEPEPDPEEPDPNLSPREQLLAWTDLTQHTVQPGDSLGAISTEYGTTIEAIAVYNGIADINAIVIGQELTIPVGFTTPVEIDQTSSGAAAVVEPDEGDSGEGGTDEGGNGEGDGGEGTGEEGDASGDGSGDGGEDPGGPPAATDALLAWTDVIEWEVGPGDTLFLISLEFTTSVNAIAALNGIDPDTPLQVGQLLRVPLGFLDPIE